MLIKTTIISMILLHFWVSIITDYYNILLKIKICIITTLFLINERVYVCVSVSIYTHTIYTH